MHVLHLGKQKPEVLGVPALLATTGHPLIARQIERGLGDNCRDVGAPLRLENLEVRAIVSRPYFIIEVIRHKHFAREFPQIIK